MITHENHSLVRGCLFLRPLLTIKVSLKICRSIFNVLMKELFQVSFLYWVQSIEQFLWAYSLYLESVAILPQLVLLPWTKNIENLIGQYVFLFGYNITTYHWCDSSWIHGLVSSFLVFCIYLLFRTMSFTSTWRLYLFDWISQDLTTSTSTQGKVWFGLPCWSNISRQEHCLRFESLHKQDRSCLAWMILHAT